MGIYAITEGCLDEAIAKYILRQLPLEIVGIQITWGWKAALRQGLHLHLNTRHDIIVFIDADTGIREKVVELENYLKANNWASPSSGDNVTCKETACAYKIHGKQGNKGGLYIVFWANPDSTGNIQGSVEDVLKHALKEAYSCTLDEIVRHLLDACKECPANTVKVLRTHEKLLPIMIALACTGGGTLVYTETYKRCGFNMNFVLDNLNRLNDVSSIKNYVDLLEEVLSH